MPQDEMSFWDHLEELRWTIFRILLALLVFTIAGFAVMKSLFDNVVMAPVYYDFALYKYLCTFTQSLDALHVGWLLPNFCEGIGEEVARGANGEEIRPAFVHIQNIKLASQFFTHMTSSFYFALLLTFPYLIFEIWRFVSPALYEHEKRNVRWVFTFGTAMFFIGCLLGYFIVFPITLRFLGTYHVSNIVENIISLDSYMSSFLMLVLIMGIAFELPLLCWLLSQMRMLNKKFFRQYRRYAIVGLLIAASFITPSGDPFTLMVVFLPLYMLYELSAFFVKEAPKEDEEEVAEVTKTS